MSHDLGALEDFPDGAARIVRVGRVDLGIIRWDGQVYALRNRCPHQGGPACKGPIAPALAAGEVVGTITVGEQRPVIRCPWHGWEFELSTGRSVWGEGTKFLQSYAVRIENGRILLDIDRPRTEPEWKAPKPARTQSVEAHRTS